MLHELDELLLRTPRVCFEAVENPTPIRVGDRKMKRIFIFRGPVAPVERVLVCFTHIGQGTNTMVEAILEVFHYLPGLALWDCH